VHSASDLAQQHFDLLDEDEVQRLALRGFTEEVRAALRRKVNGIPVYANVETTDASGQKVQQYKQTEAFDVEDYRIAIASYSRRARAEIRTAEALIAECANRLGVQLTLPAGAA
jgi:hypothetical protein